MSEEVLQKLLDITIENRDRLERLEKTVEGRFDIVDGKFEQVDARLAQMDNRLGGIDDSLDNIESELGTVKEAVLDVGRSVKSHDLAIKEIQARYH